MKVISPILRIVVIMAAATDLTIPEVASKRFHSVMGPFQVKFRRIEKCPDAPSGIIYDLRDVRTHFSQKQPIYSGNVTLPFYLNDTMSSRITLASWSNMGGWKENAHVASMKKLCTTLNSVVKGIWIPYLKAIYGEAIPCPIIPNISRFINFTVYAHEAELPFNVFFYGRWRVDSTMIFSNGDLAACMRIFADTIPV